ncbi:DNA mismatch endonuclease Vsr [Rhizobium leguminosarum]|uniref:very short patch repair endonuclease n=1 Tax=Rhizobium leguminosarum TaxID=384 RepID=UPI001C90448C|nr:very short patch repair endonuclease [Rhizobium leguminosarum]MBY2942813.1 DNA mismatch endonuclease Vsr [Rhizobium leguminosarum]
MDKLDPERRSRNMARVQAKNTGPEMRVRRIAHRLGLRFRLHRADLPGKPDLVFPRHGIAVFVHGCFWHRHVDCKRASIPATRLEFWEKKFKANVARDLKQQTALEASGWTVLVFWECELKDESSIEERLRSATNISLQFKS